MKTLLEQFSAYLAPPVMYFAAKGTSESPPTILPEYSRQPNTLYKPPQCPSLDTFKGASVAVNSKTIDDMISKKKGE